MDTEGAYADFSNCENSFRLRYALGIHKAKHEDLERFQSHGRNHNYVSSKQLNPKHYFGGTFYSFTLFVAHIC